MNPTNQLPPQSTAKLREHTELFGILALVLPFVGFAIPGLILGILSYRWSKAAGQNNGMAVAGIVVSIIAIVLTTIGLVLIAVLFGHLFETCRDLGPGVHQVGNSTYTCS